MAPPSPPDYAALALLGAAFAIPLLDLGYFDRAELPAEPEKKGGVWATLTNPVVFTVRIQKPLMILALGAAVAALKLAALRR